jgi:uncharacterized protein (DUF1499 family)
MKTFYLGLSILIIVVVISLTVMACSSRAPKAHLIDGKLKPCPNTPNCVSSESDEDRSKVAPLPFAGDPEKAWQKLRESILEMGGHIQKDEEGYLWATYTSRVFRFVDDVELQMDKAGGVVHVRSASRVGHSDLGVNRKRVEKLRGIFQRKMSQ